MINEQPPDKPAWLWPAVALFLLLDLALLKGLHWAGVNEGWVNAFAQVALATLLFWYVLETRRVANETRRVAYLSEAQLALLRDEDRYRLAPWVVAEVLDLIRYDDPNKNAFAYAEERSGATLDHLLRRSPGSDVGPAPQVEANTRQVRLRLEGENLAQQISIVLRYGPLDSYQLRVPAADVLSTAKRLVEVELPAAWKKRPDVTAALAPRYGNFPMSVLPMKGSYVALVMRDALGRVLVVVRSFADDDGTVSEHGYFETTTRHMEGVL